ncbi:MAG: NFACT RNA binding domain-containing protein [Planctomycetota bacterium]|nr:NFACT RNA binding domain-containing protein [Planctomycetota bacterium]
MRLPLCDLERAVAELATLRGRFVDNVYQCGPRTFLLKLRPDKIFLVIDLEPGRARLLATDDPPAVPDKPPVFGAILRSAVRGGKVLGVTMPARDRVFFLDIDAGSIKRIVVEALSRHANLLLLDDKGVVTRVVNGEAAKRRGNPVGAVYGLPTPPKIPDEASLVGELESDQPFAFNFALDRLVTGEAAQQEEEDDTALREKALARVKKSIDAVHKDLGKLPDATELRRQGETLLTHYGELNKGMQKFKGVALDKKLTPQENVDRIFTRARKAERARPILKERLHDLTVLSESIAQGGPVPRQIQVRPKGEPQPARKPYRTFKSADGRRILVGKGGRDNDETTMRVAGPHDLFLHVRGTPGAHVIVPLNRNETVPEQTLLDAATLAVHYSKMRTATAADVTYTPRKFVSKPRRAKPGLVTVSREKVLRLRREPDRLSRLLMTAGEE